MSVNCISDEQFKRITKQLWEANNATGLGNNGCACIDGKWYKADFWGNWREVTKGEIIQ